MEKEFTLIAMKCTQEQFDAIKPKLKNIKIYCVTDTFETYPYLVNWDSNTLQVSNITEGWVRDREYEVHETWNEEIFLRACGIKDLIQEAIERGYKEGVHVNVYGVRNTILSGQLKYRRSWLNICEAVGFGDDVIYRADKGWAPIIEETLEQQLSKAQLEVKRLEYEINKPKVGDVVFAKTSIEQSGCIFRLTEEHPVETYVVCEKITDESVIRYFSNNN